MRTGSLVFPTSNSSPRIEARAFALKLNRRSRVDSIGVPPDARLGGHEHGMARVEAGAGCRPIHVQPRVAIASDLFEQNRHGRISGGEVVPNPAWAEVLNDMADGDAVPVTALTLHFPDTVGRSKLERWVLFRSRRE